jgi:hypothetical protein
MWLLAPDFWFSWPMEKLSLKGREEEANRVGDRKDPKADPNRTDIPRDVVADIVVVLMFGFGRRVFWGGH